jgi:adenylate kinase
MTGETYHLDFNPPPASVDPEHVIQRKDDHPDAVLHRLEVYHDETAPLEAYYRERELLLEVDGVGTMAEVHARIVEALAAQADAA